MPILDFTEVAVSTGGARRDEWEFFAREFLEFLGFKILVAPDRGPDGGRDIIVEETRTGIGGETRVQWLVSCKHKAHSGASVSPEDERDVHDRVQTHHCGGFLAVYSTIPSSGLAKKLNASPLSFEVQVYDPERIERHILSSSVGIQLGQRFFPISMARWKAEDRTPANILVNEPKLLCAYCGRDLLVPGSSGIVVVWKTLRNSESMTRPCRQRVYWCCKGACDRALSARYQQEGLVDGWEDISGSVAVS